jgi:dTDP-4-amino-4,6-dideoxygalactose transaminase
MNPERVEQAITPRTKAIIPVHLYGQMADMDPILRIASAHNLKVIEDAAQAQGAMYKDKFAGSVGDVGCFSFYPGKNLGAYGEAGAITTNDDALAEKLRMFRDHGQSRKYYHDIIGWNGRMDGFQGAVLDVKLKHLKQWTNDRRRVAELYRHYLDNVPQLSLPIERETCKHVYHIYAVHVKNRDNLIDNLKEAGVSCAIHYPVPVHRQKAYSHLRLAAGSFPVAEQNAAEELSLPMFPELTEEQVKYVAEQLKKHITQ